MSVSRPLCLVLLWLCVSVTAQEEDTTCAVAIMAEQLLSTPEAYPEFCRQHAAQPRAELRAEVQGRLQAIRAASQDALASFFAAQPEAEIKDWLYLINAVHIHLPRSSLPLLEARPEVDRVFRFKPGRQSFFRSCGEQSPAEAGRQNPDLGPIDGGGFDPEAVEIPWNLEDIGAARVWKELGLTGEGVVVGLMDQAWCLSNPDLREAVWRNPDEIAGNGLDDDGNGYCDDLFGYNFAANTPVVHTPEASHGLMCGGIIAGRGRSGLVTGVAPQSQLMSLTVLGRGGAGFFSAFEYALENGADIVSMSFMQRRNPEQRALWRLVCEQLSCAGVLLAGGAGNFARKAELPEQIWTPKDVPCVLAVAGVNREQRRPAYSSMGPVSWGDVPGYSDHPLPEGLQKPDFSAFCEGFPIQTPSGPDRRANKRGNSFAGPHAVGIAALMLEAAPDLKPWQIQAILAETARDLFAEGWDGESGWGLLDAHAAVQAALEGAVGE